MSAGVVSAGVVSAGVVSAGVVSAGVVLIPPLRVPMIFIVDKFDALIKVILPASTVKITSFPFSMEE